MSNYEEHAEAMWEEIEGKSKRKMTDRERFDREVSRWKSGLVSTQFGTLDLDRDAMKDIRRGEHLTWEEYLDALFNSRNNQRRAFAYCYYGHYFCEYYGQIERIDAKKGKILFRRIMISGEYPGGDCFSDKEDHVWMELEPFNGYKVGECVRFCADIYRYLKTRNGVQISFGLCNPEIIARVDDYHVPTDEELRMQASDQIICEVCMYNEHCSPAVCLADEDWLREMRATLFAASLAEPEEYDENDDEI